MQPVENEVDLLSAYANDCTMNFERNTSRFLGTEAKRLTLEIAHKWKNGDPNKRLNEYTLIDDDAADALTTGNDKDIEIYLDGLTWLSDAAAQSLSKCQGELTLNGLTSISPTVAQALSKQKNGILSLNGLISISDSAAEAFATYAGGYLSFGGLTALSDSTGVALSRSVGSLYLSGLNSVSDTVAAAISKHKGKVFLEGLTSLTHRGLAGKIAEIEDEIQLPKLTALSDEAADVLFTTHARLFIEARNLKSLNHLGLARKLAVDSGEKDLMAVTSLSAPDARQLCAHQGNLDFTRLTTLTDEAAEGVAAHKGDLFFDCPISMSGAAAKALAKHAGSITFFSLPTLLPPVAEGLSYFKGSLSIRGLSELSDSAADALSRHEGTLDIRWLTSLSDVAAEFLSKHKGTLVFLHALCDKVRAHWLRRCFGSIHRANPMPSSDGAIRAIDLERGKLYYCTVVSQDGRKDNSIVQLAMDATSNRRFVLLGAKSRFTTDPDFVHKRIAELFSDLETRLSQEELCSGIYPFFLSEDGIMLQKSGDCCLCDFKETDIL